ncbi:MAG: Holliday junction branch migration protein RuvA [Alphaproteobacteria bacterium]|nr:Holliday junction branch migration protein RuvA [Alphaproteobacteria bacterium]
MIGKLQGVVDYIGDGFIILMVNGVGYKVYTPEIFSLKENIALWIETIVREDSIRLFGFSTVSAQGLFNQLTSVSGVGPKVALAVMATIKTDTLLTAISTGDAKTIAMTPGVGKKVAEKIILELKSKVGSVSFETTESTGVLPDLLSALESLGYHRMDIIDMAQHLVAQNPDLDLSKLVPLALKEITSK